MFFTEYGTFTDDTCPNCKKSDTYLFTKKTENRTFLFFTLGTKSKRYFKRCINCCDVQEVDNKDARSIIDYNFYDKDKKDSLKHFIQSLIPYVVLIALIIGIVAINLSSNEHAIKRALANEPDGIYHMYNKDSNYLATVSITDSVLTYDMFAKYKLISAQEYDNVIEDQVQISYYYETHGDLKMCTDTDSSVLMDKRNVCIERCFYDPELNEQFYYWGVKNYEDISYTDENNAIYTYEYYDQNNEIIPYKMYYKKNPEYWAELYYIRNDNMQYELDFIEIYYVSNDQLVGTVHYDCRSISQELISDFSSLYSSEDIIATLEDKNVLPTISYDYTLFGDTAVVQSWQCKQHYENTTIITSANNEIKKLGRYYVMIEGDIIRH